MCNNPRLKTVVIKFLISSAASVKVVKEPSCFRKWVSHKIKLWRIFRDHRRIRAPLFLFLTVICWQQVKRCCCQLHSVWWLRCRWSYCGRTLFQNSWEVAGFICLVSASFIFWFGCFFMFFVFSGREVNFSRRLLLAHFFFVFVDLRFCSSSTCVFPLSPSPFSPLQHDSCYN